jgi:hypothetical protein
MFPPRIRTRIPQGFAQLIEFQEATGAGRPEPPDVVQMTDKRLKDEYATTITGAAA